MNKENDENVNTMNIINTPPHQNADSESTQKETEHTNEFKKNLIRSGLVDLNNLLEDKKKIKKKSNQCN